MSLALPSNFKRKKKKGEWEWRERGREMDRERGFSDLGVGFSDSWSTESSRVCMFGMPAVTSTISVGHF